MNYIQQREVFQKAIALGWTGKEPSVLGGFYADKSLKEALEFLKGREPSTTLGSEHGDK